MNGIRARISSKADNDGFVNTTIEWMRVVDNQIIGAPLETEEFRMSMHRSASCSYVSRVVSQEADVTPGTFWIDEEGRRHFFVKADAGELHKIGMECDLKKIGV